MSPPNESSPPQGTASEIVGETTLHVSRRPRQKTQLERVLSMLLARDAVCSTSFLEARMPRAAALVHLLRKAGHVITTQPCSRGHYHEYPQIEYVHVALPYDPTGGAA